MGSECIQTLISLFQPIVKILKMTRISPRILQTEILITASKEKGKWFRERKDLLGKQPTYLCFSIVKSQSLQFLCGIFLLNKICRNQYPSPFLPIVTISPHCPQYLKILVFIPISVMKFLGYSFLFQCLAVSKHFFMLSPQINGFGCSFLVQRKKNMTSIPLSHY